MDSSKIAWHCSIFLVGRMYIYSGFNNYGHRIYLYVYIILYNYIAIIYNYYLYYSHVWCIIIPHVFHV